MPTYRAIHFEEAIREGSQHFERESLRLLRASAHLPIAAGGGARPFSVEDAGGSWLDCHHATLRYVHVSDEPTFAALEKVRGGHSMGHTANMGQNEKPAEAGLIQ